MPKAMNYKEISKLLKKEWFYIKRQKWSHIVYSNDSLTAIVPFHWSKDIPGPTINSILKQAWLK
jgi:predicted RNA binding protein YcfA (HicA-like mRNA interferase family)